MEANETTGVESTNDDTQESTQDPIKATIKDERPNQSSYGWRIKLTQDDDFVYQHLQYAEDIQRNWASIDCRSSEISQGIINGHILTQLGLGAGLKKFGEQGRKSTIKELKQMMSREVFLEICSALNRGHFDVHIVSINGLLMENCLVISNMSYPWCSIIILETISNRNSPP